MLSELGGRIDEFSENFNKDTEEKKEPMRTQN